MNSFRHTFHYHAQVYHKKFSRDRFDRLFKRGQIIKRANTLSHNQLESFKRIRYTSSIVKIRINSIFQI